MFLPAASKIQPHHLEREVRIYVRQSTDSQVLTNTASTARQYDLVGRALDLGWRREQVVVIDEDQARSGTSTDSRGGYARMLHEICSGRMGAVISLESSRLSRDISDWQLFLKFCEISRTLIISETSIRDPCGRDDRLLLNFDGIWGDAEGHIIKDRFSGAKLAKAQRGELRILLPPGLVYDRAGGIVMDPDEDVRDAVRRIFDLFDRYGSAQKVTKHLTENNLKFPKRPRGKGSDDLEWVRARHNAVLRMLHNPVLAGAYVYGRYHRQRYILNEGAPVVKYRLVERGRDEWLVLRLGDHEGYITWEQFLLNEQKLSDNCYNLDGSRRGAAKAGMALLQGIVMCGRCGARMGVAYQSKRSARYLCLRNSRDFGEGRCQSVVNGPVDDAVVGQLMEALTPAHLEAAVEAFAQAEARSSDAERRRDLLLKRARAEEKLMARRFMKADPDNDLVYRRLQREWNEKLAEVGRLEREAESPPGGTSRTLTERDRQAVLDLVRDVPKLWRAAETTNEERKQVLRHLVKEVTLIKAGATMRIGIRWRSDVCTEAAVKLPEKTELLRTGREVVDKIRHLAPNHSDRQIADVLNGKGVESKFGKPYNAENINRLRHKYKIPTGCPETSKYLPGRQRGDGRCTTTHAGHLLGLDPSTVSIWCRQGRLDAVRHNPLGAWWIKLTPGQIPELKKMKWQHSAKAGPDVTPQKAE